MKIQKVIFSCDLNPHYVGFWNSISKHFDEFLGMESQLICIGDPKASGFSDSHGEIKVVKKLENYAPILQALWAKFYYTREEPNTSWMIGDLDLYPLQKKWFKDNIKKYDENSYLHLNNDAYGKPWDQDTDISQGIAGYYHVAKGSTFQRAYNFRDTFEEDVKFIAEAKKYGIQFHQNVGHTFAFEANPSTWGWYCAEEHYTKDLLLQNKIKVENVSTIDSSSRICRSKNCEYDPGRVARHEYVDMHSLRPYEKFELEIEKVLSICRNS